MQENQLPKVFLLTLIVTGVLLLLSFLPPLSIGSTKLRKVNMLADIAKDKPKPVVKVKALKKKVPPKQIIKDEFCAKGVVCIEDYSEDKKVMWNFVRSLKQTGNKPVRIAFFGDSFIEGDILTASLRDTLQSVFGGRGVGYMPVTSEVARFRSTIQHTFSNWTTYSFVGKKNSYSPLGTPGFCFIPQGENEIEYKPGKKRFINQFDKIRLFYTSKLQDSLHYTLNDTLKHSIALDTSSAIKQVAVKAKDAKSVKFNFHPHDSLKVYGLSFENGNGIYVDNLAMRGNSGMGILQVSNEMHRQFNQYQDYSLIILQYGLNVASESDTTGYVWYTQKMVRAVNNLKESFPKSSILIVSVSDRSSNQDGKFATMTTIPDMVEAQRKIARQCKVAFWDLFTAMGGENSMIKYAEAVPPLAAKDYTHLTFLGGKKIARMLTETILQERERYEPKKKK
jgi:lysophospholipase L1-like esterase